MNPYMCRQMTLAPIMPSILLVVFIAADYTKFGYWYEPDGRTEEQQRLFEQVEVKPQALEWILSTAANFRYFASSDNLNGQPGDTQPFKPAVYRQVQHYASAGLPKRAETLRQALAKFYGTEDTIDLAKFDVTKI